MGDSPPVCPGVMLFPGRKLSEKSWYFAYEGLKSPDISLFFSADAQ
jgi:hypothetical protein